MLATWNRRPLPGPLPVPANARLVEWLSYSQTMPGCALVICHAGHGTLARALACGVPGAGRAARRRHGRERRPARLGRRRRPAALAAADARRTLRLAARRALRDAGAGARGAAASWPPGRGRHDGAGRAADLVEQLALSRRAVRGARTR